MTSHNKTLETRVTEKKPLAAAITKSVMGAAAFATVANPLLANIAIAGPKGGNIIGGTGDISSNNNITTINQASQAMAIEWNSFNVNHNEVVNFLQPNASSVVLNQILGQNPSEIHGSINANGQVILSNPRGILFTETSSINVDGIVASGLKIDTNDFMNGEYAFTSNDASLLDNGFIINHGVVNASSSATFIGNHINNSGLISADVITFAAGDEVVLTFDNAGMVGISVDKAILENKAGVDSAILNSGEIQGSKVLLNAKVSQDAFSQAVNNDGVIEAIGIDASGGSIRLIGSGGSVISSGVIDVSSKLNGDGGSVHIEGDSTSISGNILANAESGQGGSIAILGDEINLDNGTEIQANGNHGGGTILIGGDYQGSNTELRNAQNTQIASDVTISANALLEGHGGKVIVWSDGTTLFYGTINANGGKNEGNGGLVETSGKKHLVVEGIVTARASQGEAGMWLLDPGDIIISDDATGDEIEFSSNEYSVDDTHSTAGASIINVADLETALEGGTSVTVKATADDGNGEAGDITLASDLHFYRTGATTSTLILDAEGNIYINATITTNESGINPSFSEVLNLDFRAGDKIEISSSINTRDVIANNPESGTINFTASEVEIKSGVEVKAGQDITISPHKDGDDFSSDLVFNNAGLLSSTHGDITITVLNDANGITHELGNIQTLASDKTIQVNAEGTEDSLAFSTNPNISITDISEQIAYGTGSNKIAITGLEALSVSDNTGSINDSSNDDTFEIQGANSITVAGITFTGIAQVNADNGGSDTVSGGSVVTEWTLSGIDNSLVQSGVNFNGIETASGAEILNGTANADEFTSTSDNTVSANSITFMGITQVNAGAEAGDTLISSEGYTLTATGFGPKHGIIFNGIDIINNTGTIIGSDNADHFEITGTNSLTTNNITFTDVSSADGAGGDDRITNSSNYSLSGTDNAISAENINFTDIDIVTNTGRLTGTTNGDTFAATANSGEILANNITFQGVIEIHGGGSFSDSFIASNNDDTNLNFAFDNSARLTFDDIWLEGIENITDTLGRAIITASNTLYEIGNDLVRVNGISFTKTGASNLDFVGWDSGDQIQLAVDHGRTGSIDSNSAELLVNSDSNNIALNSNGVDYDGVEFININEVTLNPLSTGTITNLNGHTAQLTGASNTLTANNIQFNNIDTVNNTGALIGENNETSNIRLSASDNVIEAENISFDGVTTIEGGTNGLLDVNAQAKPGILLNGSGSVSASDGITLSRVGTISNTGSITGTSNTDQFQILGNRTLSASNITFTEVNSVDGSDGNDTIENGSVGSINYTLSGTDNAISVSNVVFTNIDTVTDTGSLTGTTGGDVFSATANSGEILSDSITFQGVTEIHGGGSYNDSFIASNNIDTNLNFAFDDSNQLTFDGIWLEGIETITDTLGRAIVTASNTLYEIGNDLVSVNGIDFAKPGSLNTDFVGWDNDDQIQLTAGHDRTGSIDANGSELLTNSGISNNVSLTNNGVDYDSVEFTNINEVTLNSTGTGTISDLNGHAAQLTGTNNEVSANGIQFNNINTVNNTSTLIGENGETSNIALSDIDNVVNARNISFTGVNTVEGGANGSLSVNAETESEVTLNGDNAILTTDGITLSGVSDVLMSSGTLTGNDDSSENFIITQTSNEVTASNIAFSGISNVNAGNDSRLTQDTLSGSNTWSLRENSNELSQSNIIFTGIDAVENTGALIGTSGTDEFIATTNDSEVIVNDIVFSSVTSIDGGLSAPDEADLFIASQNSHPTNFTSSDDLYFGSMLLDGIEEIYDELGRDILTAARAIYRFTADAVTVGNITFRKTDITNSDFNGWDLEDQIELQADHGRTGTINANNATLFASLDTNNGRVDITDSGIEQDGVTFTNLNNVILDNELGHIGIIHSQTASSAQLTTDDNQLISGGIHFSNADIVTGIGGVIGEDDAASEVSLTASSQDIIANNIEFGGVQFVSSGTNGSINVDATAVSSVQLNGLNQVKSEDLTLTIDGVENVSLNNGIVLGQNDLSETFTIIDDNSIQASAITFTGVSTLNAGSDTDSTTFDTVTGANWTINSSANSALSSGIIFNNIEFVENSASITGSNSADSFTVTSLNTVTTNSIEFSGVTAVNADSGSSAEVVGDNVSGFDFWELSAQGIIQQGIEFFGLETVFGNASPTPSTTLSAENGSGIQLTGTSGEVLANNAVFTNINQVSNTGLLIGSDSNDTFTITASQSLTVGGMNFNNVTDIDAGENVAVDYSTTSQYGDNIKSDSSFSGSATVSEDGSIAFADITLTNIETLTGNGLTSVSKESASDNLAYTLYGSHIAANNVGFINIDSSGFNWGAGDTISLGANHSLASSNVNANGATLLTGDADDIISLTALDETAIYDGVTFQDLSHIDAGAGDNTVLTATNTAVYIDNLNTITAKNISIERVQYVDANNNELHESTVTPASYSLTGSSAEISTRSILFSNVHTVNGSTVIDSVLSPSTQSWYINDDGLSITANDIQFKDVENAQGQTLFGSAAGNVFTLNSDTSISTNNTSFTGINNIDGLGGNDSVDITAIDGDISVSDSGLADFFGINFSNIENWIADTGNAVITTTGSIFELNSNSQTTVHGITFQDIDRQNSITSDMQVRLAAGHTVTGTVDTNGATLSTGDANDELALANNNQATYDSVTFTGLNNIDTGLGTDTIINQGTGNISINGDNSISANSIDLIGIENVEANGATLTDASTAGAIYELTGSTGSLSTRNINFSGTTSIIASTGTDEVTGSGTSWELGSDNTISANGITFSDIETAQGTSLTGTSGSDSFSIVSTNSVQVNYTTFSGITSIDGSGGEDTVDLTTLNGEIGVDEAGTVTAGGFSFSSIESWIAGISNTIAAAAGTIFTINSDTQVTVNNVTFDNINLEGSLNSDMNLQLAENHTATQAIETNGATLLTGDSNNTINITGTNQAAFDGVTFNGLTHIDAEGGQDSLIAVENAELYLNETNAVTTNQIFVTSIEAVNAQNGALHESVSAPQTYALGSESGNINSRNIDFTNVSTINSNAGTVIADNNQTWQLIANQGISANDIEFFGITAANGSQLLGTNAPDSITLDTNNTLTAHNTQFSGITDVDTLEGHDTINITDVSGEISTHSDNTAEFTGANFNNIEAFIADNDNAVTAKTGAVFTLLGNTETVVNAINFSGINRTESLNSNYFVQLANNHSVTNTVNTNGGVLLTSENDDSLAITGTSQLEYDNVAFKNLDQVITGDGIDTVTTNTGSWTLSDNSNASDITNQGITISEAENFNGANTVIGSNQDDNFTLLRDGTIDANGISFTGVSSVLGGEGQDSLTASEANPSWVISSESKTVSGFSFDNFETLFNTGEILDIVSDYAMTFAIDLVEFVNTGITLHYDSVSDIHVDTSAEGEAAVSGELIANNATIETAGDVKLDSTLHTLTIQNKDGKDITVAVLEKDNLSIGTINAGSNGSVSLESVEQGSLSAENYDETHITAANVSLGDNGVWSTVGTQLVPLRFDTKDTLSITAGSYVDPEFVNARPSTFAAVGDQVESIAGTAASEGVKSASQEIVSEAAQADPAIFNNLEPFSVATSSVQLSAADLANELIETAATASGIEENHSLEITNEGFTAEEPSLESDNPESHGPAEELLVASSEESKNLTSDPSIDSLNKNHDVSSQALHEHEYAYGIDTQADYGEEILLAENRVGMNSEAVVFNPSFTEEVTITAEKQSFIASISYAIKEFFTELRIWLFGEDKVETEK